MKELRGNGGGKGLDKVFHSWGKTITCENRADVGHGAV